MNELVSMVNGIVTANSRKVAEHFGKEHSSVLKSIQGETRDGKLVGGLLNEILVSGNPPARYFIETTYQNRGKTYPQFELTRDGFSLLVMGFTGSKALKWKLEYIEAFNKMEHYIQQIDNKAHLVLSIYNGGQDAILSAKQLTEIEVKEATTPLLATIEEQKPMVDFVKHVTDSSDAIDIGELAKLANNENIKIGRNRLFQYLRDNKIFMNNNEPYQKYIENKWFKTVETTKQTSYGTKIFIKTLVLGKGQVGIIETLRKAFGKQE